MNSYVFTGSVPMVMSVPNGWYPAEIRAPRIGDVVQRVNGEARMWTNEDDCDYRDRPAGVILRKQGECMKQEQNGTQE